MKKINPVPSSEVLDPVGRINSTPLHSHSKLRGIRGRCGIKLNLDGTKKVVALLTIIFLVMQLVSPVLLYPKAANAQFAVSAPVLEGLTLSQKIWTLVKFTLKTTADIIFKNMLKDYLNQLAYNAATKIATGEKGQKPLFLTKPLDLLKDTADKAFGDFIDQMARDWSTGTCGYSESDPIKGSKCKSDADCAKYVKEVTTTPEGAPIYGPFQSEAAYCIKQFSLCEPLDPGFKVKLSADLMKYQISGKEMRMDYQAKCPISGIIESAEKSYENASQLYEQTLQDLEAKSPRDYLKEISKNLNPEASDYGMFLIALSSATKYSEEKKENEKFAKQLEGEFKSVTSKISGEVMSPAAVVGGMFQTVLEKAHIPYATQTGTAVADAIGVFFNTLTSKLLKQIYEKGLNPKTQKGGGGVLGGIPTAGVSRGIAAAESMFASLRKPDYNVSGTTDILGELATCPSDANVNNCVIDDRFRLAIEQKKTVREAIEEGLVDGTKTFGYDAVTQKDPDYRSGYPLRSLLILRKYRIIPVGWELAAKYIKQYAPANFGLKVIMDSYDDCGRCVIGGNLTNQSCRIDSDCGSGNTCDNTQASKFCGLVDPNWVLKIPEVYCKREGAGEKVVSDEWVTQQLRDSQTTTYKPLAPESGQIERKQIQRMDYCADEQTCIAENEDGSCRKFGYCVEEKLIWRFNGDQCEDYYNSCQTFVRNDGAEVSYLKNTLNYNNCSADNAGCQWFCEEWDRTQSRWVCQAPLLDTAPYSAVGSRINFNGQVEQCNAKADGCDELIRTKRGLGTNLIRDGSFELGETDSVIVHAASVAPDFGFGRIDYWPLKNNDINAANDLFVYKTTDDAYTGGASLRVQATAAGQGLYSYDWSAAPSLSILPKDFVFQLGKSYTLSAYVKVTVGAFDAVSLWLGSDCPSGSKSVSSVFSDGWQRLSLTFPASENIVDGGGCRQLEKLNVYSNSAATFYLDAVKLEEGAVATSYKDYESGSKVYLNGERISCTADEVGCELYTPKSGGQPITGIITDPSICNPLDPASCDQCPAEYVGCKAYREMPIERMPYRQATDPISFVSSTGRTCPASAVGCEEYTNLDELAKGGEGKEYFSYIRLCVLPDSPDLATYYTWMGSEEFGYQLKSYRLKVSSIDEDGNGVLDDAPCTNIDIDRWPACGDTPATVADCSDTCVAGQCNNSGIACTTDQDCIDHALSSDPDCAEFYDQQGDTHYRLKSRVIYASDNCLPYRNSFTSQDRCEDTDGNGNPDHCVISGATCLIDGDCRNEACSGAGGTCSQTASVSCADSNDCPPKIFHLDPDQGIRCSSQNAGCREYAGSASNNVYTVLASNFESGTISPWTANTNPALNPSNESIQAGGHSMLVAASGGGRSDAYISVDNLITKEKSYTLSFWAKGAGVDTVISADFESVANYLFPGSAAVKAGDWNKYSLGPLYHEAEVGVGETLHIFANSAFYIDNIVFEEVSDHIYLIKNSYIQCSGYENCAQYTDRDKAIHYLKSFSKLCKDDKVGCEALIDTQNSNNPFREEFDGKGPRLRGDVDGNGILDIADVAYLVDYTMTGGPQPVPYLEVGDVNNNGLVNNSDAFAIAAIITNNREPEPLMADLFVPDDQLVYLVNDKNKYCKATEQGCTRFGSPSVNQNNEVTDYEDVYLVSDPDQYNKTMCDMAESGCGQYSAGQGDYYYFKDPGVKTCEYKRQAGASSGGWYKSGSTSTLPDCPVINVGNYTRPASGWVGKCLSDKSGCSEYRDPHEPANCNVVLAGSCNSYYYINSSIDLTGCNGVFNPDKGCLLFADQTQINTDKSIRLMYDSDLTYASFEATRKDTQPTVCTGSGTCAISANACTGNADCSIVDPDPNNICISDCDSNTIIKVTRDRTCNKWLECRSSKIEKNQKGENEEFCYAFGVCNRLDPNSGNCIGTTECSNNTANHCANATEEASCTAGGGICRNLDSVKSNLTFNSPADVDSVRYMSGSVVGGLSWANNQTIAGYYPYAAMEQIGLGGMAVEDLIVEGDFGDKDLLDGREPSITGRNSVRAGWTLRTCSNNNTIDCARNEADCITGGGQCGSGGTSSLTLVEESKLGQIKTGDQDNLDENNILEVNPGLGANQGVYYKIENGLYGNQQYVVSFRIRYKDEPNDSDKLTVGFAYARAGAPEPAITEFANFVTGLHPSTEFKQYVFGPFTADPRGGATYLRFVQETDSTGRTFYLDDVSLKPVLEANSDPRCLGGIDDGKTCINNSDCTSPGICYDQTEIARSCRMYPKSDAPFCTYTDEKAVTYRGWYGYCIEKDPINPQYCLNWWPVDIIAGESNVFGQEEEFSYTGRVPLYMCVQARGNYSRTAQNALDRYRVLRYHQYWVQSGGCVWYPAVLWGGQYTVFLCANGVALTFPVAASDPEYHIHEEDIEKVHVLGLATSGNPGDWGEWTFQPPLQEPYFSRSVDPVTGVITWAFSNEGFGAWNDQFNHIRMNLNFNAQGQFESYYFLHNDGTGDQSEDDNAEGGVYNVIFYLREPCTKVAQVADTELTNTKPWAQRVKSSSNYTVQDLRYKYEQDYAPYGGAKEPSNISPTEWNTRPYEDGNQPLYVESILTSMGTEGQVRAGSPYSCVGQCGGGMCIGGEREGNSCARNFPDCCDDPDPDINPTQCVGNQGLCVGVQLPTTPLPAGDICYDTQPVCSSAVPPTPDQFAIDRLERLFAKPVDGWSWQNIAGINSYVNDSSVINAWNTAYNTMISCAGGVRPAYDPNNPPSDYCGVPPQVRYASVTAAGEICNSTGCTKDIPNDTYAQISFDVSVNEEQVPMKVVYIDWDGDGTADQTETGNYPSGKRTFNYKLSCSGGGTQDFIPRIRIKDNWDWCNQNNIGFPGNNRFICNTWYDPDFTFTVSCAP